MGLWRNGAVENWGRGEKTMSRIAFAAVIASLAVFLAPAQAQDLPGPSDNARYTFHRVEDMFLRLDVRNGQVSQCGWAAIGWYCRVVPDERTALQSEIDRLQISNTALKKELIARGLPLPDGIKADPQILAPQVLAPQVLGRGNTELKLPGDVEPNQATGMIGKVWRRMV